MNKERKETNFYFKSIYSTNLSLHLISSVSNTLYIKIIENLKSNIIYSSFLLFIIKPLFTLFN